MPHTDETFYKMAVNWTEDPKVAALDRFGAVEAILARDLFSQMIGYSRRNLTDGFVPTNAPGMLMYPLPVDHAERLALHLADRGAYGALCEPHAERMGWQVVNYAKWNDTRAEVQARTESGRKAARTRWDSVDADRNAGRNADGNADGYAEQEQEKEQENLSAHAPAREDPPGDGDDLDGLIQALMFSKTGTTVTREEAAAIRAELLTGRAIDNPAAWIRKCISTKAEARRLRPTRNTTTGSARPARDIIDQTRRPGGPARDVTHWAQIARKGLAGSDGQADTTEPGDVLQGEIVTDPDPEIPY